MEKKDLRIIVGGADPRQRQNKRMFVRAFATNSRLMGVVVLYIQWEPDLNDQNNRETSSFHQFFYIETSEAGIESYKSVIGDNKKELDEIQQSMIGGLGADKIEITEREACILIKKFAEINEKNNQELPSGYDEYGFLIEKKDKITQKEYFKVLRKICVEIEGTYDLINYFLMRYYAKDAEAVKLLVSDEVFSNLPFDISADALCLNRIDDHVDSRGALSWISESLIEVGFGHRIIISDISVFGGKITSYKIISDFPISAIETAMKLERPEFVTVFEIIKDDASVENMLDKGNFSSLTQKTKMGKLYLSFNRTNDHLTKPLYRLNDDVKGMIYITNEGQIVLSAYSLSRIRWLEQDVIGLTFGANLLPLAKYEFKEDVFYDFIKSDSGNFVEYIEYICDFDPHDGEE